MRRDPHPQKLATTVLQDQQSVQQPKRDCRDDEQVYRCDAIGVIAQEGPPALRRRRRLIAMYFATVVCPTSMPSLSSSPGIRGAPQSGFAMLVLRIKRRTSAGTGVRPPRGHDFQRQ
jgi:hypothetical protein